MTNSANGIQRDIKVKASNSDKLQVPWSNCSDEGTKTEVSRIAQATAVLFEQKEKKTYELLRILLQRKLIGPEYSETGLGNVLQKNKRFSQMDRILHTTTQPRELL